MRLLKAHAYGNDFLIVDERELTAGADAAAFARAVCDRHRGIGADGLMIVRQAGGVSTRLINADGSAAELSGNGLRCVAAWLAGERALTPGAIVDIETVAGRRTFELLAADGRRRTFRAAMGQPTLVQEADVDVGGGTLHVVRVHVGNPHCVVLGPATRERLETLGPALTSHAAFPGGTNVELVAVESPSRLRLLIWERGVGPTESSGTGTLAAAVAAASFGGAARTVDVESPGGTQRVEWTDAGLFLTGWAEVIATIDG